MSLALSSTAITAAQLDHLRELWWRLTKEGDRLPAEVDVILIRRF